MDTVNRTEHDEYRISLMLSAQRALLGNIPPRLRCVSIEHQDAEITCRFVFDGEPTKLDKELLSCAATEIISDYPDKYKMNEEYLAIPYPTDPVCLRYVVFKRYETRCAAKSFTTASTDISAFRLNKP